jgi:hypothetical protein
MFTRYLPYSRQVLKINLAISTLTALFWRIISSPSIQQVFKWDILLYMLIISFLTGGFFLGVLFFEFSRSREYYFYYNQGISKPRLILMTYLMHVLIIIPVLIVASYAQLI